MNYISKLFKDKDIDDKFNTLKSQIEKTNNISTDKIIEINTVLYKNDSEKIKFNTSLYRDLEIFETYDNSESQNTVFNKINFTHTLGAKNLLEYTIKNPIYNVNILNNRKKVILKVNSSMEKTQFDSLSKSLKILKKTENSLYWFLQNNDKDFESMKHMLYFPKILYFLNNYGIGLTIKNIYNIFLSPLIGILSPISYFIIPYCIIRYKFNIKIPFLTYLNQVIKTLIIMYKTTNTKILSLNTLWIGFSALIYFQNIITSFSLSKLYIKLSKFIINKINDLSEYTLNTQTLSKILYNSENIENFFNFKNEVIYDENLVNNKINNYEFLNNFGNKLKIYRLINKDYLIDLLKQSYCCDFIFSLCILQKEFNLCIPNYLINIKKSKLNVKNCFHPLVIDKRITNSVLINNKSNMIITGPNAAGKSTFIKSLAINTLLSQSICLCFSKKITLTPFSYIASQINTYDINGQKSLFQAEMYNIKNIIDDIKLNNNSIIFLDELFNSTNIIEGISASYSICDMLSQIPTNLTIFATHFLYLCKLSKNKKYKNYKFEAFCTDDDIIFPYKLKKGISSQYIALEILKKNNFDEEIINNSINIKNKILSKCKKK
jgi:DNA mismatch repair ATPase MutS